MKKNVSIFLLVTVGIALLLLPSLSGLAEESKVPIKGWGKAKFGMSPRELRNVYRTEARARGRDFWEEKPESFQVTGSLTDAGAFAFEQSAQPHVLCTSAIKIFERELPICFAFVEDELFQIKIAGGCSKEEGEAINRLSGDEFKTAREKVDQLYTQLHTLDDFLTEKYGKLSVTVAEGTYVWKHHWVDSTGNSIVLKVADAGTDAGYYPVITIHYTDKERGEKWDALRNEILGQKLEKEEKRLRQERIKKMGTEKLEMF